MAFTDISDIFEDIFVNIKHISIVCPVKKTYQLETYGQFYRFGICVAGRKDIIYTKDYFKEDICNQDRRELIELIKRC